MKAGFHRFDCHCTASGKSGKYVRHGKFYRRSDSRWVNRWRCTNCKKTVSLAFLSPNYRQHKRKVNYPLYKLLCSGVSLRRCAVILNLNRITVVRKFRFLAERARLRQLKFLEGFSAQSITEVIFDEMETFEHSKMKPVSIALAVTARREILATELARIAAKGPLAEKARKKYGYRRNERPQALRKMFKTLERVAHPCALFKSDQNPSYPLALLQAFPNAQHETTKGGRSCVVGQGELKKLRWDPLFSLNHTAAMFRANMNRLFRKTWCTTKTLQGLSDHIAIYVDFHNQVLLQ